MTVIRPRIGALREEFPKNAEPCSSDLADRATVQRTVPPRFFADGEPRTGWLDAARSAGRRGPGRGEELAQSGDHGLSGRRTTAPGLVGPQAECPGGNRRADASHGDQSAGN